MKDIIVPQIKNKQRKVAFHQELKHNKKKEKRERQKKRKREEEELGDK